MKSTAVYRTLREIVAPWCKANGFRRTAGGMLGWYLPLDGEYLAFWFQCSQEGYDGYAGSRFVVELQQSESPRIGTGRRRMRIAQLLDDRARARVHALQNEIIARLPHPPEEHVLLSNPQTADWYRRKFAPELPYGDREDIWFRYHDEDDVKRWGQLILTELPAALDRFRA